MNQFLKKVYFFFKEVGFVRAASSLANQGKYEEAKAMLVAKNNCKK